MNVKEILLIEDDKVDVMAIKRTFKDLNVPHKLNTVSNGVEALEFLQDPANQKPALIILDINMPQMNGIEFLKSIKNNYELKRIPVVILTTSRHDGDRESGFNSGAAGYMIKPVDYNQFLEMMRVVTNYWQICEMPPS